MARKTGGQANKEDHARQQEIRRDSISRARHREGHGTTGYEEHESRLAQSCLSRAMGYTYVDEQARSSPSRAGGLSCSTKRAKWIESSDEHEDRPGQTLAIRSHEVIMRWAEARYAQPATIPGTAHEGQVGTLRFNFPGYGGKGLEAISWEEWFEPFDERQLVFLFQEHKHDGAASISSHSTIPSGKTANADTGGACTCQRLHSRGIHFIHRS